MKFWYKAVCDSHKEMCDCFVRSNHGLYEYSKLYLEDKEKEIVSWLEKHSECALRIVFRDEDLDVLFENKYKSTV